MDDSQGAGPFAQAARYYDRFRPPYAAEALTFLAAAVGDEPALIAELREAFLDSVKRAVESLRASKEPQEWAAAALRLKGLAASFGAVRLMALASETANAGTQDKAPAAVPQTPRCDTCTKGS